MAYGLKGGSDFVDISKKEIRDGFTGAGYAWANLFVRFNFTSN
jgi:hypothetical protein